MNYMNVLSDVAFRVKADQAKVVENGPIEIAL